jgi:hypothetical protein
MSRGLCISDIVRYLLACYSVVHNFYSSPNATITRTKALVQSEHTARGIDSL